MTEYLRWGILGASRFAAEQMAPALHAATGGRLCALATGSPDKIAPFTDIAPDLRVHGTYEALLDDPDIDAVYIPLPHTMHVEWSLKAIAAGKHVLCEKPIAMRADDIDALIAARDASGLLVAEAYMIVHHPQWAKVKDLIAKGAIGALGHISAQFTYNNQSEPGNIRNAPTTGGGSLPDIGVYTLGSMRWVTGLEPTVDYANITREGDLETTVRAHLRFGDSTADSLTSMRLDRHQQMTFFGTKGRIIMTAPFNARVFAAAEVRVICGKAPIEVWSYPEESQYELQVAAFNRSALTGADYPWTLENAQGTQRVIDAIYDWGSGT